jgi:metallo-beta-lactamase class B
MNHLKTISFILILLILSAFSNKSISYKSDTLKIETLTENVWVHTSYLQTTDFGNVGCNGMVYCNNNQAIIFDTPTTDSVSLELINWIESELKCEVIGVVATHFHNDCLGGLAAFHQKGINSFANELTIELAKAESATIPQKSLKSSDELMVGDNTVIINYFGEGHTKDNIVAFLPNENVLFGGCLIKELNTKKGYLGDANVNEWSNTVAKIKAAYPNLKWIIPGHGKPGNTDLLDYTITLFNK